jgi:hypothetical protein
LLFSERNTGFRSDNFCTTHIRIAIYPFNMDSQSGNDVTPDSLKRKRYSLTEDDTPDFEHDRSEKKRNTGTNDKVNRASMDTAGTTDGPVHSAGAHMDLPLTTANSQGAGPKPSTVPANKTIETVAEVSKPTLQTLPRELRDMIYDYVAADEEHIVLGRRMVEARRANSTWTLDKCFNEAVALHPLSMTCRQFRDEFQGVHFSAPDPRWILVVNNFNLEQLQIFSDWIQSEEYVKVLGHYDSWDPPGWWDQSEPLYDQNVSLRLQMDESVTLSASDLCEHVYFEQRGDAPSSLADSDATEKWLGIPEISTQYVPRTTAPVANRKSMTLKQAKDIKTMFKAIENTIVEMPTFLPYLDEDKLGEASCSFYYMEWCWFEEFYACVDLMDGGKKSQKSRARNHIEILRDASDDFLRSQKDKVT